MTKCFSKTTTIIIIISHLTWHNSSTHLLAASGQGERDQRAIEQRFGQVRVQVRHGRRERRNIVRQPMVGIFDPTVHVAHPIIRLVLEVQAICVINQSGPIRIQTQIYKTF